MNMMASTIRQWGTVPLVCSLLAPTMSANAQADDMRYFVGTWDFRIWGPANTTDKPDLTGT